MAGCRPLTGEERARALARLGAAKRLASAIAAYLECPKEPGL